MRKLLLLIFYFNFLSLSSQTYGHEWIDINKPHYKFPIITNGIYRIPFSYLQANCPDILAANPSEIAFFNNGEQIPIYLSWTAGSGTPSDYIEFYAKKLETEIDKKLYDDSTQILNPYTSLFKDTNYYFITLRLGANERILNLINDTSSISRPYLSYCQANSLIQFKLNYNEGRRWYYTNLDYVYSPAYDVGEGWGTNSYSSQIIPTPNSINIPGVDAQFKARIFGKNETSHKLEFKLNNSVIGSVQATGSTMLSISSPVISSGINSASTNLTITPLIANTHGYCLGFASILYTRDLNFSGLNFYTFSLANSDSTQRFSISNYNSGSKAILYDLINKTRIEHSASSSPIFKVLPQRPLSLLVITNEGSIQSISSISKINLSSILSNQASFIIISHRAVQYDSTGVDIIAAYKSYKESSEGGSYSVSVIYMDELQEFFGYGIPKHPIAIRKYLQWAYNTWSVKPKYALMIGKGYSVNGLANYSAINYANCLIPSFGHAPSDYHYSTMDKSLEQFIPIGRIAASNGQFVKNYLNKLKEYNAQYNAISAFDQTPEKKEYMKWMIHLGGGQGVQQQQDFRANLKSYEKKIADTLHGAKTFSVFKNSPDISEDISSVDLTSRIDKGVSLISFFGHSSATIFDVGIGDPLAFTNKGKYPVFLANGCNSGYFYSTAASYSENFINQPNKGAIAFVATTNNALDVSLYQYSDRFYDNLSKLNYNNSVGTLMQMTSKQILASGLNYINTTPMEFNLNGDPSVMMTQYPKPDYYIDNNFLLIPNTNFNTTQDSISIKLIVQNIGKAIKSTIKIKIERINNGRSIIYEKLVNAPYFKDTFTLTFPTLDDGVGIGNNSFNIKVDMDDIISEMSEFNNEIKNGGSLYIENDDIIPIFPYEYSIVSQTSAKLVAMSTRSDRTSQRYHFQFDTSANFNSPFFKSYTTNLTSEAILSWLPPISFQDSVVYYWRVSKDTVGNKTYRWNNSSFIYIPNQPLGGWNQSHYFQYLNNEYQNTFLGTNRKFQFVNDVKNILIRTDGSNGTYEVEWYLNNARVAAFREQNRITNGLFAIWIDGKSGISKQSLDTTYSNGSTWGSYGSIMFGYPGLGREGFVFQDTGNTSALHPKPNTPWSKVINDFVNQIPVGDYVIFYTLKKPVYNKWDSDLSNMLLNYGFTGLTNLLNTSIAAPFIFGFKKNDPSFSPIAKIGTDYISKTTQNIFITGIWNDGFTQSVKIGPAQKWNTLNYQLTSFDLSSSDTNKVELYGYRNNAQRDLLATFYKNKIDTNISWIDADKYINLQLKLSTKDDKDRTPAQIKYWRIYYEDIGEVAVNNGSGQIPVMRDTIENGENWQLYFGSETLNSKAFDSISVKFNIRQGNQLKAFSSKLQPVGANSFQLNNREFGMKDYFEGENTVSYEINPIDFAYQREKFNVNNYGRTKFFVKSDIENPILDVTFDGQHIINNELVSSTPKIKIVLKDENKFLLLNDTSLIKMYLKYPDGNLNPFYFNHPAVTYILATSANQNRAEINYFPTLSDGSYQLIIKDADKSGNSSSRNGSFDYKISFQVISKNQISQFFNYPNPFTSSTQFVFTLTGSKTPDFIKIQIMNIRGQVVKEIFKEQLGPIKLGVNRSVYAWDGRDEYGDQLANGVYLYKVTVKNNGEDIPLMDEADFKSITKSQTNLSKYFTNGWGKMVLIR